VCSNGLPWEGHAGADRISVKENRRELLFRQSGSTIPAQRCSGKAAAFGHTDRGSRHRIPKWLPNLMEEDATGVWNALHSAYDPLRESRDRASTVVLNPDSICVVLGFGAGYLLEALLEREAAINTRFLVIEPNPSVFKEAMRCRDLRALISCPAVDLHIGVDLEVLTQVWEGLPPARRMQPPRVVQHFASVKSHARFYHAALELIKRQASKTRFEIGIWPIVHASFSTI